MSSSVSAKVAAAVIDGVHTDVAVLGFSNCIVVLATQLSSVGSLIQSVISSNAFTQQDQFADPEKLLSEHDLPVDVRFVLGNASATPSSSLYEIMAIHATQLKHKQNPSDGRPLLFGVALRLPREISGLSRSLEAELPDLTAYTPLVNAITTMVGECRVW
ncbi:hypothetical protein J3B02_004811 [Coemansia erecta]|uniref:Proteasome assembly chaperone 3 n=1 Tax=Coemansia asiatica TaxID=1052880 RepID=A0A9W8CJZ9_9FUNG|nr:hypothetical protein LPJ64_003478 [Coemansia asiatica]KAJ2844964.1 hypothetical protein J3B02_004811 [Coemansia erecta]KAJ2869302.1 hypothetical protein FB639_004771 [Coemansia asiatica]